MSLNVSNMNNKPVAASTRYKATVAVSAAEIKKNNFVIKYYVVSHHSTTWSTYYSMTWYIWLHCSSSIRYFTIQCKHMELDSVHWFSQRRSPMPHFGGCAPGGYKPQIWTLPRFLYNAPTPKFHHPIFTRSEVIELTNRQTHPQTNRCCWKHPTLFATLRHWVKICWNQE